MKKLALFAEHSLEEIKEFKTEEEREAYGNGFSRGANCYGAGSCPSYRIPEDINPETGEIAEEFKNGFITEDDIEQIREELKRLEEEDNSGD